MTRDRTEKEARREGHLLDRLVAVSGRESDRRRYAGGDLEDLQDFVEQAEAHAADMDRRFVGSAGDDKVGGASAS